MYEDHFRLKRKPFSIAPDPGFLFLSDRHREALAHLMYGLQTDGGFVLVTGEVGTGKTTLIRSLIDRIPPNLDVAFILNPRLTAQELLETLCEELGIPDRSGESRTVKHYVDRLTKHLLRTHAMGRSTVLIIDEAQNLSPTVLEQIRLLTNLETNDKKLLRIILLGQPELADLLDRRDMRQLSQRITARYHLGALNQEETKAYVAHRLALAGGNPNIFTPAAARSVFSRCHGIPRLINVLSDRAMLGAYVEGVQRVSARIVGKAAKEVFGAHPLSRWVWGATALLAVTIGGAWAYLQAPRPDTPVLKPAEVGAPAASDEPAAPAQVAVQIQPQDAAPAEAAVPDPAPMPSNLAALPTTDAVLPSTSDAEDEPADTLLRPQNMTPFETQRQAYQAVFDRWNASIGDIGIPCNQAPQAGLQCLKQTGGWNEIIRIDRPAVLELWDEAAEPFFGAVTRIDGDRVGLRVGNDEIETTRAVLERHWYGNFVVLWRMPPYYRGSLKRGDRSPTVTWLRETLARATSDALDAAPPDVFDGQLHEALIRFQRASGLIPDGVAGPATWIMLNSAIAVDDPRLERRG